MKKSILSTLFLSAALVASAQELPKPSPAATVNQRIGLTDITIEYSRPSAKGREVFGTLVKYNELWRTGANKATAITFSTEVKFGGTTVAAGKYSIFSKPGENEWVIMLNKETELWGTDGFDEAKNVATYKTNSQKIEKVETFTIAIDDLSDKSANLIIKWDGVRVSIPIEVEVDKYAMENVEKAIKEQADDWNVMRNCATFLSSKNQNDRALDLINKSLALKNDNWYSHYVRAEILGKLDRKKEAIESAQMALNMGAEQAKAANRPFNYAEMVENKIIEMGGKVKKEKENKKKK